jgi:hypothetical protein
MTSSSFLLAVAAVMAAAYCLSTVERLELLPSMINKRVVVRCGSG